MTGDETYIYKYDPETKQQSSVWLFPGQPAPQKRSRSTTKQMIAVFFSKSGHVVTVPLQERKTVNAEWYISTFPAQSSRGMVCKAPKGQYPPPPSPPRQRLSANGCRNIGLFAGERGPTRHSSALFPLATFFSSPPSKNN